MIYFCSSELKSKSFQTYCTLLDISSGKLGKYIRHVCGLFPMTRNKCACIIYDDEVQLMSRLIKCFLVFRITIIVSLLSHLCILSNTSTVRNKTYQFQIVYDNYGDTSKILENLKHSVHDEYDRYICHFILELCNINKFRYTVYNFLISNQNL